jgi:hypothetical protein
MGFARPLHVISQGITVIVTRSHGIIIIMFILIIIVMTWGIAWPLPAPPVSYRQGWL